jgi:hypothetical protein
MANERAEENFTWRSVCLTSQQLFQNRQTQLICASTKETSTVEYMRRYHYCEESQGIRGDGKPESPRTSDDASSHDRPPFLAQLHVGRSSSHVIVSPRPITSTPLIGALPTAVDAEASPVV